MKLEIKLLTNGAPVLIIKDDIDEKKRFLVWHSSRLSMRYSRAFIKGLKSPETESEKLMALNFLASFGR